MLHRRNPPRHPPARARQLGSIGVALVLCLAACGTSFADASDPEAPVIVADRAASPPVRPAGLVDTRHSVSIDGLSLTTGNEPSPAEPLSGTLGNLPPPHRGDRQEGAPAGSALGSSPEPEQPELLATCSDQRSIVVHKAARILELRCGDALVRRFEASLGFAPEGHKEREGDGRTPEGEYFIATKYPSRYHRSLELAYPNAADAAEGLRRGTISRGEHDAIVRALASCREPPQTTGLGSVLQIHGSGGGRDVGDWTLGCVAVDDPQIEQVYAFHRTGCDRDGRPLTPVRILP